MMHHWHFDIAGAFIGAIVISAITLGLGVWLARDTARVAGDAVEKVNNVVQKR